MLKNKDKLCLTLVSILCLRHSPLSGDRSFPQGGNSIVSITALHITILILSLSSSINSEKDNYEPVANICDRCTCTGSGEDQTIAYFVLDCSMKNLKHLVSGWPEIFGSDLTGREIVFSLSGNEIVRLQQLPATEATLLFSCRHCSLEEITSAAFLDVPNISRLDLSWNKLNSDALHADIFRGVYDSNVYEPINVEEIDFSHNSITELEKNIFEHTPYLKRLSLASNPLKNIEGVVSALSLVGKMEHLDLSYTNIEELPEQLIRSMPNLRELLIQGNKIIEVPASLSLLKSLKSLYLGGNPIESFHETSFTGLSQLTHLNISWMPELQDIGDNTFATLINLEVLICSHNPVLTMIDVGSLRSLKNFRELDLSYCALKSLYMGDVEVDIEDKNIPDDYDQDNKKEFTRLRSIELEGNPWHCDCEFYKVLQLWEHHGTNDFYSDDEARCATPYDWAAKLLSDLEFSQMCSSLGSSKMKQVPKPPIYEPPPFLRPRSIVLSILSVTVVVIIGLIIGFGIVCIKKKLAKNEFGFTSPVRYTTVRDSTTSTVIGHQA